MVYKIMMQRKSLFYVVNLIVPTFLISFLTVVVFFLPTHDGEKITLSLGLLFALGNISFIEFESVTYSLNILIICPQSCSFCLSQKLFHQQA